MYEIIPNLYLSNFTNAQEAAKNMSFYQINCTKQLPMFSTAPDAGMRIAIDDDQSNQAFYDFLSALPDAIAKIDAQLLKPNGGAPVPVVVHCLAGQQRSPAVIAAYLLSKGYVNTLADAVVLLREKKKDAFFWSVNFKWPLEQWAAAANSTRQSTQLPPPTQRQDNDSTPTDF